MTTPSPTTETTAAPTAADYYRVNRGGGLFSEAISQRIGARIAVFAHKHRLAPTVLTVANLVATLLRFAALQLRIGSRPSGPGAGEHAAQVVDRSAA